MTQFTAASSHRLLADLCSVIDEPAHVLAAERAILAARAQSLVSNGGFPAAMVKARLHGTHGAAGLRLRSLYHLSDEPITSPHERSTRRSIDGWVERCSAEQFLDASGINIRRELEVACDWSAIVLGDGYLVKCWKPNRPGNPPMATCWRQVHPDRVCNPDDRPDDDHLQQGHEFDQDGHQVAIHVELGSIGPFGMREKRRWVRIPIWGKDGCRQVIHKRGMPLPGVARGITCFAPFLLLTRQVDGVLAAHVAAKRAQAIHAIICKTDDPELLAAAQDAKSMIAPGIELGPISMLFTSTRNDISFPQHQYQGNDLDAFCKVAWRVQTAAWHLPLEVVLCMQGEASLAASRANLDQYDRTSQGWQFEHENVVSRPIDGSLVREAVARGEIQTKTKDWTRVMAGRYLRPTRYSTDKFKDAQTVKAQIEAGRSKTSAFAEVGWDYEDEVEQDQRDREYLAAHRDNRTTDQPDQTGIAA